MTHRALVIALALAAGAAHAQQQAETPAGRVPPPQQQAPTDGLAGEAAMIARPAADTAVDIDAVVRAFAAAYEAQRSPRVIVYFNRELSADVREWVATERVAVEAEGRGTRTGPDGTTTEEARAGAAVSRQFANSDGGRVGPGELWMWEFEQAVADLLLDARVNLVDRAVVMRREAAGTDTVAGNPAAPRTLEMAALDRYADLLVEVWVARSADSAIGYEFRAQAKDIRTGRLVAMVTTWGEGLPVGGPRPVVATATGYEFVEPVPTVHDAAQALTVELMESLTGRWR